MSENCKICGSHITGDDHIFANGANAQAHGYVRIGRVYDLRRKPVPYAFPRRSLILPDIQKGTYKEAGSIFAPAYLSDLVLFLYRVWSLSEYSLSATMSPENPESIVAGPDTLSNQVQEWVLRLRQDEEARYIYQAIRNVMPDDDTEAANRIAQALDLPAFWTTLVWRKT